MRNTSIILFSFLFVLPFVSTSAQDLWQQKADYNIAVTLDPGSHSLSGKLTLSYTNHSPQALDSLYFHLWPNAYSSKTTPFARQLERVGNLDFRFAKPDEMGRMEEVHFYTGNKEITCRYLDAAHEKAGIALPAKLESGKTTQIEISFKVVVPAVFSRMGHYYEHYCITQWFPKVALYDQKGWHRMPYLDLGEYYDDFGDYDVHITVPKNYVVAATGNLLTQSEVKWLNKRARLTSNAHYSHDYTFMDAVDTIGTKTLHFREENIHDFAWFANPAYLVSKQSFAQANGDSVVAWAFYEANNEKTWFSATNFLSQSVKFYAENVGAYAYQTVKAVAGPLNAGGGMEYPTITVISSDIGDVQRVILHEVGHNWFQGMLGTNERRFPYLDEGYNSYYENRFYRNTINDPLVSITDNSTAFALKHMRRRRADQACNLHSNDYDQLNYGISIYTKTAENLDFLEEYLGTELFDSCMTTFFDQWKFSHPGPLDFKQSFEKTSGKNLDWFFDGMLGDYVTYDYDITKKRKGNDDVLLTVKKTGGLAAPFKVSVMDEGGNGMREFWVDGVRGDTVLSIDKDAESVWLNRGLPQMEDNTQKNSCYINGHKPTKIKLFGLNEKSGERVLDVWPAIGVNTSDKTMLGLVLMNPVFPQRKFEYQLVPLYALGSHNFNWLGNLQRNWFWKSAQNRKHISLGINSKSFGINYWNRNSSGEVYSDVFKYIKVQPFLHYKFGPRLKHQFMHEVKLRTVIRNYNILGNNTEPVRYWRSLAELSYSFSNSVASFPYELKTAIRGGDSFAQLRAELKGSIPYNPKKDIRFRLFAGTFLKAPNIDKHPETAIYQLRMSNLAGFYDYMLDGIVMDRARQQSLGSRQLISSDGGIVTPNLGFGTSKYLLACNLSAAIPKLPLRFFVNGGFIPEEFRALNLSKTTLIEAGLQVNLYKDMVSINLPFLYSAVFKEYLHNNPMNFWQRITFTLDLGKLNPVKLAQNGAGSIF